MIGISQSSEKRAIIDIGSNTVRLVVYNGPPRAPTVVLNEKVNARLGKDLGRTGVISEKSMRLALAALERFAALLRLLQVTNVDCVATAAARDARNGPEFLDAVRSFGLAPRLLSGQEEANASAAGIISAFPGAHGVVADLGGGSLELVEIGGCGIEPEASGGITLPLGTLRLADLRAKGARSFAASVGGAIRAKGWTAGAGVPLYIVGGSWRALALQAMRRLDWPVDDPHGFSLPADEALRLARIFAKGSPDDPDPRISSSRLASLPDAAALLAQVITTLSPSCLIFSSWGLREGLLHLQLPAKVRQESPMLASVAAFTLGARVSAEDAARVTAWTAPVCDEGSDAHEARGHAADLRTSATLLALAAMRTEPNMRTEEALGWALRKRWIGIDMRDRAMMAMATFANSGQTTPPAQLGKLAGQADLDRAVAWGLAVRLCRRLTGGSVRALALCALAVRDDTIVLTLQDDARALYSSSIAKDLKALAEWLGLEWRAEDVAGAPIGS